MSGDYFKFEVGPEGLATLTLDAKDAKVNLLTWSMMAELDALLDEMAGDSRIRALVIRSAKKDVFIAGADIHEIEGIATMPDALKKSERGQAIVTKLEALTFPKLCAIDGACVGGGLELALACDYRLATDGKKTRLGLPEVTLGIVPGFGGSIRLPRLIGLAQSLPMILSGKSVDGKKAAKLGLVDELCAAEFLDSCLGEFLRKALSPEGRAKLAEQRKRRARGRALVEGNPIGRAAIFASARRQTLERSKGQFPAPLRALRLIRRSYGRPLQFGLRKEREAFAEMAVTSVSKNLIGLFFADESLKKDYAPPKGAAEPAAIASVALLGAGKMGGGIAWLASSVGLPLRMKDVGWDAIGRGYAAIGEIYGGLVARGKLDEREASLSMHNVSSTLDYSGFRAVDLAIEAIVEDPEAKMRAYAELEEVLAPDAVIATNTSSLKVDDLSASLRRPERFIGMHFFNPVDRMPLVEIVSGARTSPETLYRSVQFARRLRKTPIVVKDCHGFLVNRILMAYLDESLLMLEEGTPFVEIDRALLGFGMPLGPFALIDEIGIKVAYKVAKVLAAAYPKRSGSGRLLGLVSERPELAGKAAKRGFYLYGDRGKSPNPDIDRLTREAIAAPPGRRPGSRARRAGAEEITQRALLRMINEAALCLGEGIIDRADYLDMAMLLGTGFPAFRGGPLRYADALGSEATLAAMRACEEKFGARFAPALRLEQLALSKGKFYS